jgi:hypothetical protein
MRVARFGRTLALSLTLGLVGSSAGCSPVAKTPEERDAEGKAIAADMKKAHQQLRASNQASSKAIADGFRKAHGR